MTVDRRPERSILITGCSSGIGLCAAETLKVRGWRVFATARKPHDIARLKDEVGVESFYLDYAEPDSIVAAAEHVLKVMDSKLTALADHCARVDRPFDDITKTVSTRLHPDGSAAAFAEHARALDELGIDHVIVLTQGPWTPDRIEVLAEASTMLRS